ncbi:hypothetical protein NX059_009429 [Plenodomus lindquistii]|nr:hypothetical protein NX059_009429 [Plenodomus lindquistii]
MVDNNKDGAAINRTPSGRAPVSHKKKATSLSTSKRLPWLDNKTTRAVHVVPLDGQTSEPVTPPGTTIKSRKPSSTSASKLQTKSVPLVRRKPLPSPRNSIKPVATDSSPSPVARHGTSQTRRSPTTRSSITGTIRRTPPSSRGAKKGPLSEPQDSSQQMSNPLPHLDILASVPDQHEQYKTPQSCNSLPNYAIDPNSPPPHAVSRVQVSPTQPVPARNTFERVRDRRISNAVEDLEDMVQEAVEIADETADQGQVEEIYGIIQEAKASIQEASHKPSRRIPSISRRLRISEPSTDVDDHTESYPNGSDIHRGPPYPERTPPPVPPANHASRYTDQSRPLRGSVSHNRVYAQPGPLDNRSTTASSSSTDRTDHRHQSTYSTYNTTSNLLLPPPTAQTTARDHVDFVLRPRAHDSSHSRGSARRRIVGGPTLRPRRHHHHHRSEEGNDSRSPSGERIQYISDYDGDTSLENAGPSGPCEKAIMAAPEPSNSHIFSRRRNHQRQPVSRNWSKRKKRFTAMIACMNTALLGIIVGVYAGEVPAIQYYLADENRITILGNVVLYYGLAISTFIFWPLPLLHGRKPYVLAALAIALPLQFPQAIVISVRRSPTRVVFRTGLLCARAASGLVFGFANINYITVLLDLFGASLQSSHPHQEIVVANDVRRHGGGMGMWLGIWCWCWIGSLAVGFTVGAVVIEWLSPDWGFYIVVIVLAVALVLNIMAPETRRAPYRKNVTEVYDVDENYITRRVERGEVKLHSFPEGPRYWFEEVWAGLELSCRMLAQPGFLVLALYTAWMYAQIVLIISLLGSLLSHSYAWGPSFVGLGVLSLAIGSLLAIPLTKARIFSRDRTTAFRTDSMTFQREFAWSSHLVRRTIFTLALPVMGLVYTLFSTGRPRSVFIPIVFAGAIAFLSTLGMAECIGLVMETWDTCDLQPGVNTRHRFESMAVKDQKRRTEYSSFPRVTAGIFAAQSLAFVGAGVATAVGGSMTRRLGAQAATGVTAGILLGLTLLLGLVLLRFKSVQVIPNHTFGTRRDTAAWQAFKDLEKVGKGEDWKAVVIGNPSGKMRRMNVLELGKLSRWTEIRKLNFLIRGDEEKKGGGVRRGMDGDSW